MSTLYLCGVGNAEGIRLAIRVNEAEQRWDQILLLDDNPELLGQRKLGLDVVGPFDHLRRANPGTDAVVNLVTRTTEGRAKARARVLEFGVPFASLVAPGLDLFGVELSQEVTLYPQVYVGAEATIARSAVALVGAMVGHGVALGEGAIVAPKAVINARVKVGARAYIGSNASILPDLTIGEGATVAANSVVVDDVPAGATAIGVPASVLTTAARAIDMRPGTREEPKASGEAGADPALVECIGTEIRALLGIDTVPLQANFFDLGGTSLKALQLSQILRDRHGLAVQLVDIYHHPSLQALVEALSGGDGQDAPVQQARQRAALRRQRMRR